MTTPDHTQRFVFQSRFIGRKLVQGPLNDIGLSLVVTDLLSEAKKQHEEFRCSLEFSDKNLLATFIKKDEGFESDGESTKSSSTEEVNNTAVATNSVEEKIIKDHVFKLNHDDTSSANSSGSDSDENAANNSRLSKSTSSSTSTSPTADIQKYKFDHKDSFPISDVLICHTDQEFRNCLVWVIRTKSGDLEALVLECSGEEEVKEVYRKFLEVSKRSKLERHRRRKSDGGSVVTRSVEALFNRSRKLQSNEKTKSVHLYSTEASALEKALEQQNQSTTSVKEQSKGKGWNLIQHTDRNGITHIEVESSATQKLKQERGEILNLNDFGIKPRPQHVNANPLQSEKSKFARELENILSKELESRKERDVLSPVSVSPNAAMSGSVNSSNSKGAIPRVRGSLGESQSLRQRAPAMLLKKLDEFEEKAHKVWSRGDIPEEENRKVWSSSPSSKTTFHGIHPSKAASRTPPPPSRKSESLWRQHFVNSKKYENTSSELQSLALDLNSEVNKSPRIKQKSGLKIRVPSPPPGVEPGIVTTKIKVNSNSNNNNVPSPMISGKRQDHPAATNSNNSEKQILIPTKTGKEPVKKLYPKEATPRIVNVAPLPAQLHPAALQFAATQPHSLPIYPLQLTAAPIAWARYPTDISGDPSVIQAQWAASRGVPAIIQTNPPSVLVTGNRGRSRDRGRLDPEMRRRAQSKSPARKSNMSNSNLSSEVSKKFRELSDAVRQKIGGRKAAPQPLQVDSPLEYPGSNPPPPPPALKSNLKKNSLNGSSVVDSSVTNVSVQEGSSHSHLPHNNNNNNNNNSLSSSQDNKKVHFNKFATVQMME